MCTNIIPLETIDKHIAFIDSMRHYRIYKKAVGISIDNIVQTPISADVGGIAGLASISTTTLVTQYTPVSWDSGGNAVLGSATVSDYYNTLPHNGEKQSDTTATNSFCGVLDCKTTTTVSYIKAFIRSDDEYVHSVPYTGQAINKNDSINYDNKVSPNTDGTCSFFFTGFWDGIIIVKAFDANDVVIGISLVETKSSYYLKDYKAELFIVTDTEYYMETQLIPTSGKIKFDATITEKIIIKIVDNSDSVEACNSSLLDMVVSYRLDYDDAGFKYVGNACFIYDQALAVLAHLAYDKNSIALETLVNGLATAQDANGSFRFHINVLSKVGDPYYRTGACAWCVYALAKAYSIRPFSQAVYDAIIKGGDYLLSMIVTEEGLQKGAVRGGTGRYNADYSVWEPAYIIPWCSTEHNVDTFFALNYVFKVTGNTKYLDGANSVKNALMTNFFDYTKGHFRQGISNQTEYDPTCALDCLSWGALFLWEVGEREKAINSLVIAKRIYQVKINNIMGYKPYAVEHGYTDAIDTLWTEGSLGTACAFARALTSCCEYKRTMIDVTKLMDETGAIPYVTIPQPIYEMQPYPATVSSAWFVIAALFSDSILKL